VTLWLGNQTGLRLPHPACLVGAYTRVGTAGLDFGTRLPQSGCPDAQNLLGCFSLFLIKSEALDQSIWPRDMVNIFVIRPHKFYAQTGYLYPRIPCHLILLQLTYLLPIDLVIKERQLTY